MMKTIKYELEFFSNWSCGSGLDGGAKTDALPIVDHRGLPYVPGRTVKGLMREAAGRLGSAEQLLRLFGDEDRPSEGVVWNNAILPETVAASIAVQQRQELMHQGFYAVKLDEHGQAEDQTLRRCDFMIPMTLTGVVRHVPDEDLPLIRDCFRMVKRLGSQRSRGFGRCEFRVMNTEEESAAATVLPARRKYAFVCRFLSDIILNRSAATVGNLATLDYVPGAKFLGIAAKTLYGKLSGQEFQVFHSGEVRFGDAAPWDGQAPALTAPLNWFIAKGSSPDDGQTLFSSREAVNENRIKFQPKQLRGSYFRQKGNSIQSVTAPLTSFALKSARDSEKRASKDHCMFGYTALAAGSEWYFELTATKTVSESLLRQVAETLPGIHQLGRSRSAEYGTVEIRPLNQEVKPMDSTSAKNGKYRIYAASNLAFCSEETGEATLLPTAKQLGFPEGAQLLPAESWVRSFAYAPWNGVRNGRDGDRNCIQRGSVLVVSSAQPPDSAVIAAGVGQFRAEGFGKVLVDPAFLDAGKLEPADHAQVQEIKSGKSLLEKHLEFLSRERALRDEVFCKINEFCDSHSNVRISPSQWGAIRSIAANCTMVDELLDRLFTGLDEEKRDITYEDRIKNSRKSRAHDEGILLHGVTEKVWLKTGMSADIQEAFEDFKKQHDNNEAMTLAFAQRLCAEMAKRSK